MSGPHDRPRVYINWQRVRPVGWRAWVAAIGFVAVAFAALALVTVVATTLFVTALVVAVVAAVAFFVGNFFRGWRWRSRRDIEPYRGNDA